MKLNAVLALGAVSLLSFGFLGCESYNAPPTGVADTLPPGVYPKNVVVDGLADGIVFGDPIVTPSTETKPMRVVVPVRSIADYPINIQYQVQFFDTSRRPLVTNQGFRFMNMAPRVEQFMDVSALDVNAVDYRVLVRPAR